MRGPDMSFVYEAQQEEAEAELQKVRAELEDARPRAEEAERALEAAYGSEVDEIFQLATESNHRWMELWAPTVAGPEMLWDEFLYFLYRRSDEGIAMEKARERVRTLAASEQRLKRKIQKAKREARRAKQDQS
jgi:uncharacterized protein involved in exopolysaccharide biosynthesis